MYKGIAASRGIGIGSICRIIEHDLTFEAKQITDPAAEKDRFHKAIADFVEETNAMAEDIRKRIGPKEAEILQGHAVMISDPAMSGEMDKAVYLKQRTEMDQQIASLSESITDLEKKLQSLAQAIY